MEDENTSVQCTQTRASIPWTKAMWDADSISKLYDLCVKEIEGGHRLGTHFSKVGWENLVKIFNKQVDALKIDWKAWKQLIGKETGLGWNIKKRIIDASDEWWERKLQVVPNAAKFCKEGITLDMMEKLNKMFTNITATREYAWTPSSGVLPFESGKKCLDNLTILENSGDSEIQPFKKSMKEKIKKDQMKKLKKKAAKLVQQIDRFIDVVEGSKTSNVQNEMHECDIPQVIDVLDSLLGIEIGSELYFFATHMFFVKEKRVMFMSMKQPDLKLNWLKYHYGLGSSL
ncbi:hypothetical protein UlMin_031041 [Ulmus minor]